MKGPILAVPETPRTKARKSPPWKVALATRLNQTKQVSNGWLAENLAKGTPIYVSKHVGRLRLHGGEAERWLERVRKVKGEA